MTAPGRGGERGWVLGDCDGQTNSLLRDWMWGGVEQSQECLRILATGRLELLLTELLPSCLRTFALVSSA